MGRLRKSAAEKSASGTLQRCREIKRGAADLMPIPAAAPAGLNADAAALWVRAVTNAPAGLLTVLDAPELERWCFNAALEKSLFAEVDAAMKKGRLGPWRQLLRVQAGLLALEKSLGFTPASRSRLQLDPPKDTEDNPFNFS